MSRPSLSVKPAAPRRHAFRCGLAIALGLLALAAAPAARAVCYVAASATGANSGASWQNAYTSLQSALQNGACGEVWVKAGIYKPSTSDPSASFAIRSGTAVYGGFAGTETSRGQRNPTAHPTILSGDLAGNDSTGSGGVDATPPTDSSGWDNSTHVVTMDGTAAPVTAGTVLDGFTVTAGRAVSLATGAYGGGLFCNGSGGGHACSPTLTNLVFSGNHASRGGAICDYGSAGVSSPTLTQVTFSGNSGGDGGAIYNDGSSGGVSSPTLTHASFIGNHGDDGGAIFNGGGNSGVSSPTLTDVTFSGNSATNGGAMFDNAQNHGVSSPTLDAVAFSGNSAVDDGGNGGQGGAMFDNGDAGGDASPVLANVVFSANIARDGGAIYSSGQPDNLDVMQGKSSPRLSGVTFSGNMASEDGGAIYNGSDFESENNPELTNVTFSGNSAGRWGGAVMNHAGDASTVSHFVLTNATFSGNGAVEGGAFFGDCSSGCGGALVATNVIFWNDTASLGGPEIYRGVGANATIAYSIVQGSGGSAGWDASLGVDGGGNLDADPLLGSLADNGGDTQTMLPAEGSSAVDAGDNSACPLTDQRGVPRSDGRCDIGAVERQGDVIFVDGFEGMMLREARAALSARGAG